MKKQKYKINGVEYEVTVVEVEGDTAQVEVNGTQYTVGLEREVQPKVKPVVQPPKAAAAEPPLPGTVLKMLVKEGDTVQEGQTLLVLEAMKMENNVDAPQAGKVTAVSVNTGDAVMEGDVLLTIGE